LKKTIKARLHWIKEDLQRRQTSFCRRFPRVAKFMGFMQHRRRPLRALFMAIAHALGFIFSIEAVMQTRTEQGAVAWAFALNTIPVVAVPAWLVFGSNEVEAYQSAMRVGMDELRPLAEKLIKNVDFAEPDRDKAGDGETGASAKLEALKRLETIGSLPVMAGNSASLLVDGEATYAAILDAIAGADHYILVQFYIFRDDGIGKRIRDALVAKAREGVAVYLLLDNLGSSGLSETFIKSMEREGMKVRYVMNESGKANRFQLNFRNHRKIVVVDGKRGFLGGLNVGDDYLGKDPKLTPWRDTHMEWRGPIVKCLQVPFAEDWRWATGELLDGLDWEIRPGDVAGEVEALCLATGPADPFETCAMGFLTLIDAARDRIWLATPYFVPDDKIVTALQLAAIRGVDVRVILPGLTDSRLIHLSSFSYFEELEDAGVKFFRYQKGFLHQKVMIVDDSLSAIGSANLDNRSFRLNFEVIGIVSDAGFNGEVSRMLQADLAQSKPTGSDALAKKPFWFRLGVRLARMLAPIQ
jgi:cardiolipin synthase